LFDQFHDRGSFESASNINWLTKTPTHRTMKCDPTDPSGAKQAPVAIAE
jgi:hypothetical protein